MPCMITTSWTIDGKPNDPQTSIAEQTSFHEMTFVAQLSSGREVKLYVAFDPPLAPVKSVIES